MSSDVQTPFGAASQRTPVEFDASTGGLRIGPFERRVEDPAEPGQVYSAYLSLLYAVRGAEPGERLPLRTADLEALLLIVGDDPDTIEQRLVGLMGCTPQEASVLGRMLLRHRKATATLGIAAGLALGAAGVTSWAADDQPGAERVPPGAAAPVEAPEPIHGTTQLAAPAPAVVGPAAPAPVAPAPVAPAPGAVGPVAAAPVRVAPVATSPLTVGPVVPVAVAATQPAAPAVEAPAPAVAPGARPVPVATEVLEQDPAYALPTYAVPVLDVPPPPIEVELPDSAIGEPAVLVPDDEPLEEIGGVVDSGGLPPAPEPVLEPLPDAAAESDTATAGIG